MSNLYLPGTALTSPWGKDQPYEAVWDSTVSMLDFGIAPLSSVPANGVIIENLMADRMAEVTGLSEADCHFSVTNSMANGFAAAEITAKGGLHIAATQAGDQNLASGLAIRPSQAFAEWLTANTGAGANYAVMYTVWLMHTRDGIGSTQSIAHHCNNSSPSANRLYCMQNGGGGLPGVQLIPGHTHNTRNVPGVAMVASAGWTGTKPANHATASGRALLAGGAIDGWASANYNKAPSIIFYRPQLEIVDLSEIAGADRAAKATAMYAAITAAAARDFAEGGRFHGDTFTNPAVLVGDA